MIGHAYVPAGGGTNYGVKVVTGMTGEQAPLIEGQKVATGMGGVTYTSDTDKTPKNPSKDKTFIWIPKATFTNNFHTVFGENQNHSNNEINIPISTNDSEITLSLTDKKNNSIILNLNDVLTYYTTTNNYVNYSYYLWTGKEWLPNIPPNNFRDVVIWEIKDNKYNNVLTYVKKDTTDFDILTEKTPDGEQLQLCNPNGYDDLQHGFEAEGKWFGPGMSYRVDKGSWTFYHKFFPSFSAAKYTQVTINYTLWRNDATSYNVRVGLVKSSTGYTVDKNDFIEGCYNDYNNFALGDNGNSITATFTLKDTSITDFQICDYLEGSGGGCGVRFNKIMIQ